MHSRYILLLFLVFAAKTAHSQISVIEDGKAVDLPDFVLNDEVNRTNELLTYYSSKGYLAARIDSIYGEQIWLAKGCRFKVEHFTGTFTPQTEAMPVEKYSGFYFKEAVEAVIKRNLKKLVDEGYLLASAEVSEFSPDYPNCSVSISVHYNKGQIFYLNDLYFAGTEKHSRDFLKKLVHFRDSTKATALNTNNIRRELAASGFFETISEPEYSKVDSNSVILIFAVRELPLNTFDGLLGYAPSVNGKGGLIGNLQAAFGNVLTAGNAFNFHYMRLRPETSRLTVAAGQNWYGNLPVGIGADFTIFQNDTTYQTRRAGITSKIKLATGFNIQMGAHHQTSDSKNKTGFETEPDGKKLGFDFGFSYTTLNSTELPTSGFYYHLLYTVANKNITGDSLSAFRQQSITILVKGFHQISGKSVFTHSLNGYLGIGDHFTESDLLRLGGTNSIRGYAEEQFLTNKTIWADIEYRYLINPTSYLFAFAAAGYYERPLLVGELRNNLDYSGRLYSTGLGISYKTRIGRLSFSYAISPQESLGNGKVHFGIKTSI